jgi:ribosomal protein S12 methylthiotransferase
LKKKIGLISLGCPKNLVDSEIMLGLLNSASFEITNDKNSAHVLIVNTCGFIESAKKESIDTILEMADCKKNKCELLIVTGCLAERYRHDLIESIPEVDAVIGTGGYAEIVKTINDAYISCGIEIYPELNSTAYLENFRMLSSDKGFAYLKIAEGCDNKCTYCIIPSLRGKYRSRRIQDVIKEAKSLAAKGKKEIILISQDTTRYGIDIYGKRSLVKLIKELSKIKGIEWIRLMYCYPEEIDDELIAEFTKNKKLCRYLDIPIQHISSNILKAMGRRGIKADIEKLIKKLRQNVPDIIIRTSLIVGFPGETENDFDLLFDFVKKTKFDRLGVFSYSKEDGTKAALMENQIQKSVKEKRNKTIMKLQNEISKASNKERINQECEVIVDGLSENGKLYYGRTYGEAPDIDWVVFFESNRKLQIGDIVKAKILAIE